MKRKGNLRNLLILYLNYIFQKSTIIVFSVSLVLISISLLIISNPWIDFEAYKISPIDFHMNYFTQSLLVLEIFNTILVTTIVIILMLQSTSFDLLFLSHTKRSIVSLSKILSSLMVFLYLSIFEFIIMYLYPLIFYEEFKLEYKDLMTILILFLSMAFTYSISIVLTSIIPSIFLPMLVLFLSLIKSVLTSSFSSVKKVLVDILPIAFFDDGVIKMNSTLPVFVFIIIFIMIQVTIYNIRDIRTS